MYFLGSISRYYSEIIEVKFFFIWLRIQYYSFFRFFRRDFAAAKNGGDHAPMETKCL